nr:MAG TPA: hypothetical protein [Caudoviricetes sp.]
MIVSMPIPTIRFTIAFTSSILIWCSPFKYVSMLMVTGIDIVVDNDWSIFIRSVIFLSLSHFKGKDNAQNNNLDQRHKIIQRFLSAFLSGFDRGLSGFSREFLRHSFKEQEYPPFVNGEKKRKMPSFLNILL